MKWKNLALFIAIAIVGYLFAGLDGITAAAWGAVIGSFLDKP